MRTHIVAAVGVALMLGLSARVAFAQDSTAAPPAPTEATAAAPPAPDAATPPPAADAVTPPAAAPTETGRIIFFRPSRLSGGAYAYWVVEVGEDGDSTPDSPRIGRLPNGSYFEYQAPAGIHTYNIRGPMSVNRAQDRLRLEVEPGETYYVEQTVRMGLVTGGFALVPSTEPEFTRRHLRAAEQRTADE